MPASHSGASAHFSGACQSSRRRLRCGCPAPEKMHSYTTLESLQPFSARGGTASLPPPDKAVDIRKIKAHAVQNSVGFFNSLERIGCQGQPTAALLRPPSLRSRRRPRLGFVEWVRCAFSFGRDKRSVAAYVSIGSAETNVQMARYPKPPYVPSSTEPTLARAVFRTSSSTA